MTPPDHQRNGPLAATWPRLLSAVFLMYAVVLLWATHSPQVSPPTVIIGRIPADKSLHVAAYATLGTLAALTSLAWGRTDVRSLLWVFTVLAIFALADEVTQPCFGRAAEALDWVADMIGAGVALALISGIRALASRATPGVK